MIGKKLTVLTALLLAVMFTFTNATTFSVKQLGCGATPNCYTTITQGIANAQDGDTVKVYSGTYSESVVLGKNLTLLGSGPQSTIIYGTTDAITVKSNFNVTIIGFTIKSPGGNGIYLQDASSSIIKNNYIVGNGKCGIATIGCCLGAGAQSSIINNLIASNGSDGINAYCNNCGHIVSVTNNIITSNGGYGINFWGAEINLYNDVYSNTSGNYSGTTAGTGDISQNPVFVDAPNGNYILQSLSPCKNAGTPGSADNDPDGTRNDMGAFGGPDAAPFWPYPSGAPIITNLTVTPTSVQKGATITITATGQVQ